MTTRHLLMLVIKVGFCAWKLKSIHLRCLIVVSCCRLAYMATSSMSPTWCLPGFRSSHSMLSIVAVSNFSSYTSPDIVWHCRGWEWMKSGPIEHAILTYIPDMSFIPPPIMNNSNNQESENLCIQWNSARDRCSNVEFWLDKQIDTQW